MNQVLSESLMRKTLMNRVRFLFVPVKYIEYAIPSAKF